MYKQDDVKNGWVPKTDLMNAWTAGMKTSYDEHSLKTENLVCLEFEKNGLDLHERISSLAVNEPEKEIFLYGTYTFDNFIEKDEMIPVSESKRLETAKSHQ